MMDGTSVSVKHKRYSKSDPRKMSITDLPLPPEGKTGWPWTEGSLPLPDKMPNGTSWPRVTIVTPSFNQAQFLEETIRSVLLQGYPNLEYIIIDGGSTDGSVEIIRKYAPWLKYWISESDRGQSHAINKGFARATGKIVNWLNSDDLYLRGALIPAVKTLIGNPQAGIAYGRVIVFDNVQVVKVTPAVPLGFKYLLLAGTICQPGAFIRTAALQDVGGLDEDLHYCFDYDLYLRVSAKWQVLHFDEVVAGYRLWSQSKTISQRSYFLPEQVMVTERAVENLPDSLLAQEARFHCWALVRRAVLTALIEGEQVEDLLQRAVHVYPTLASDDELLAKIMVVLPHTLEYMEQEKRFIKEFAAVMGFNLHHKLLSRRLGEIYFNTAHLHLRRGKKGKVLKNLWSAALFHRSFLLNIGFWSIGVRAICPTLANLFSRLRKLVFQSGAEL